MMVGGWACNTLVVYTSLHCYEGLILLWKHKTCEHVYFCSKAANQGSAVPPPFSTALFFKSVCLMIIYLYCFLQLVAIVDF